MSLNLTEMGSWSIKVGGTGIGDKFRVPEVWALIKEFTFRKVLKETGQWSLSTVGRLLDAATVPVNHKCWTLIASIWISEYTSNLE